MVPRQAFIVLVILQGVKDGLGQQKKVKGDSLNVMSQSWRTVFKRRQTNPIPAWSAIKSHITRKKIPAKKIIHFDLQKLKWRRRSKSELLAIKIYSIFKSFSKSHFYKPWLLLLKSIHDFIGPSKMGRESFFRQI